MKVRVNIGRIYPEISSLYRQGDKPTVCGRSIYRKRRHQGECLEPSVKSQRAAVLVPRARCLYGRASRFDAQLCTLSLVPPFSYKYHGIFRAQGEGVFRRFLGFSSPCMQFLGQFRLVVLLLPLLLFSFLVDLVIGKRVVHRMKAKVLVREGDTL